MAYLTIRPDVFRECLKASDYELYRDGFCIIVKNNRTRRGQVLKNDQVKQILIDHNLPWVPTFLQAMFIDAEERWGLPTDEQIITWCINNAVIPHPYEEYIY